MTLLTLKNYIAEQKTVSLNQLIQKFGDHQKQILAWLELLIQKGYVSRCERKPACGTKCFKCPSEQTIFYKWVAMPAKAS